MPHLRLSDRDRERLGCPELIPLDIYGITNREAIEVAKLGYKTPRMFREGLNRKGEDFDHLAWTGAVWMALRRAGVETDIQTLEFDVEMLAYIPDPEPVEAVAESGKATAREGSTNSTTPSSTSGATSKPKSGSRSFRS